MVKGSFSFNSRIKEDYEDERPSQNYPQKLTTQRQQSIESHLSSKHQCESSLYKQESHIFKDQLNAFRICHQKFKENEGENKLLT